MKKTFRRILSGLVAAALGLAVFAFPAAAADETVGITFTADQEIAFDEDDTDGLFPAFQDLLPGDVREQEIYLRNRYHSSMDLTLRILPSEEAVEEGKEALVHDLLYGVEEDGVHADLLHLEIYNGDTRIYEGTAGGPEEDGIPLGSLRVGFGAPLRLVLMADGARIGNEYQNLMGYIDWELTASWDDPYIPGPGPDGGDDDDDPDVSVPDEDISDPSTPTTSVPEESSGPSTPGDEEIDDTDTPLEPFPDQEPLPQTGDKFPLYLAIGGAILCAAVVAVVLLTGKKRNHVK